MSELDGELTACAAKSGANDRKTFVLGATVLGALIAVGCCGVFPAIYFLLGSGEEVGPTGPEGVVSESADGASDGASPPVSEGVPGEGDASTAGGGDEGAGS